MKLAVTGGAGFIGSAITRLLVREGHRVTVVDNLHKNLPGNLDGIRDEIEFRKVDIRDRDELGASLRGHDGVFHQAALTAVQESFADPARYRAVNVTGTKNVFDAALSGGMRVVFASSSSVYGNAPGGPIHEDAGKAPINPYGQTKLDGEALAAGYAGRGLEVIGLRYFNVYGPGQTGSYAGVVTKFLDAVRLKEPLVIYGAGRQARDFVFVDDVAGANLAVMERGGVKSGFYNVGTQTATSIQTLAETISSISGHRAGIKHAPGLDGDVEYSMADMSKTRAAFNWRHSTSLDDGLRRTIGATVVG